MVEHDNKALKKGHCDLLRSDYALSAAAIRKALFSLFHFAEEKFHGHQQIAPNARGLRNEQLLFMLEK